MRRSSLKVEIYSKRLKTTKGQRNFFHYITHIMQLHGRSYWWAFKFISENWFIKLQTLNSFEMASAKLLNSSLDNLGGFPSVSTIITLGLLGLSPPASVNSSSLAICKARSVRVSSSSWMGRFVVVLWIWKIKCQCCLIVERDEAKVVGIWRRVEVVNQFFQELNDSS